MTKNDFFNKNKEHLKDKERLEMFKFQFIVALTLEIFCLVWFAWSASYYFYIKSASGWPTVKGELISVEKKIVGTRAHYSCMDVKYSYIVGKKIYYGKRIRFDDDCIDRLSILDSVVDVHFNPNNPNDSVLIIDASLQHDISIKIKGIFILILFDFIFLFYLNRKI